MKHATIAVTGPDRPGIIARTTTCLFENKANITALDERVVSGIFSMTLAADVSHSDVKKLERELKKVGRQLEQDISLILRESRAKKNIALLITKESHCLEEIAAQIKSGKIPATPVVAIGNHPDLEKLCKKLKIPFHLAAQKTKADREQAMIKILKKYDVDLVVLARYMQIMSPEFCARYEGRIINIHPSLLPAFPGARPYHQAQEKGVEFAGVTAHFVTTDLDQGPIICQDAFKIAKKDGVEEIRAKGQKSERKVLARAVELFVKEKIYLHWGKVQFK